TDPGATMEHSAQLYNVRVQAIAQYPLPDLKLYPFATLGFGLMHTSSSYLGSDSDWPIHVGVGARYFITDSIGIRADFRYMRGPSEQDPYTLNAGYAEFA